MGACGCSWTRTRASDRECIIPQDLHKELQSFADLIAERGAASSGASARSDGLGGGGLEVGVLRLVLNSLERVHGETLNSRNESEEDDKEEEEKEEEYDEVREGGWRVEG